MSISGKRSSEHGCQVVERESVCSVTQVHKQELAEEAGLVKKTQLVNDITGRNREFTFYP